MLAIHGLRAWAAGRPALVLGNGPSSWWVTARHLGQIRELFPRVIVFACNRTAARVSADVAGAVDRSQLEEMLDLGIYHNAAVVGLHAVLSTVLAERGELPIGARDGPREAGGNVFTFEPRFAEGGTGVALLGTVLQLGLSEVATLGFDGARDPRTRWQGTTHYRDAPTNPALLEEWLRRCAAEIATARAAGTFGLFMGCEAAFHSGVAPAIRLPLEVAEHARGGIEGRGAPFLAAMAATAARAGTRARSRARVA